MITEEQGSVPVRRSDPAWSAWWKAWP